MKKIRFAKERIFGFWRQADAGVPIRELCCSGGFGDATLYRWCAKFGGTQVSEVQRLHERESRNATLKRLLVEVHLDMHALKSALGVKRRTHRPGARRFGAW